MKNLFKDKDKVYVQGVLTKMVEIKTGTKFYQNRGCVQIFADPLLGHMVISPESWREINSMYTFRSYQDMVPFEKNTIYIVTGTV